MKESNKLGPIVCQYCASELVVISQTEAACSKCNVAKLERRLELLEDRYSGLWSKQYEIECDVQRVQRDLSGKKDRWFSGSI